MAGQKQTARRTSTATGASRRGRGGGTGGRGGRVGGKPIAQASKSAKRKSNGVANGGSIAAGKQLERCRKNDAVQRTIC